MSRKTSLALALLLGVAACARDEITLPPAAPVGQLTVNASAGWVYVDLATGTVVPQTTAATSTTWDLGFSATNVVVNGGAAGPAGMMAYCLCQNAAATSAAILAMTPTSQADAFARVNLTSVPPATTPGWSAETFATSKWYKYNLSGDNRISPTFDVYLVRRGAVVYKLQLVDYYGPAGETRRISFRYAKVQG